MDDTDRPYAGQEADINDKLLLDLAWERQQKKVRTHVCVYVRVRVWVVAPGLFCKEGCFRRVSSPS